MWTDVKSLVRTKPHRERKAPIASGKGNDRIGSATGSKLNGEKANESLTDHGHAFTNLQTGLAYPLQGDNSQLKETGLSQIDPNRHRCQLVVLEDHRAGVWQGAGDAIPRLETCDSTSHFDHHTRATVSRKVGILNGGVRQSIKKSALGTRTDQ